MEAHASDGNAPVPNPDYGEFARIAKELQDYPPNKVCVACRWCMWVLAVVILLPIKLVLALIVFILIWVVCHISMCVSCRRRAGKLVPHTYAQSAVLWSNTPLYRLLLFCMGVLWIRVRRPKSNKATDVGSHANATLVANHVSTLDAIVIAVPLGCQLTGVAMRWVTRMPFLSALCGAHHVLGVGYPKTAKVAPAGDAENSKPSKSAASTIAEYQRACASNSRLLPLLIFPEASTKAARCLIQFRTGAFVCGEPVQPVALRYRPEFAWVGSLTRHIFRMLAHWGSVVEVTFLPVYFPTEAEKADPTLYANNVQALLANALQLPAERVSNQIGAKELFFSSS